MIIANATGCSSIWGGSAPSTPYCVNKCGKGPAWANSLFEDNAEYGYGFALADEVNRNRIKSLMESYNALDNKDSELEEAFKLWLSDMRDERVSKEAYAKMAKKLDKKTGDAAQDEILEQLDELRDYMIRKSVWVFGGDGWAYDIGFGGLDHVLASGKDINVFVFDTEVYSNTGGQSSKATPTAAVAKFAASGKKIRKKDLGLMMTSYGYVYVAQIALGANMNQALKAIKEAEEYDGPSIIIAYAPCINHGLKCGMGKSVNREKQAVAAGYWHLYRFDPRLEKEGKNPFVLDSKDPTESFQDFIGSEVRYTSLQKDFPDEAEILFKAAEEASKDRLANYKRMAGLDK